MSVPKSRFSALFVVFVSVWVVCAPSYAQYQPWSRFEKPLQSDITPQAIELLYEMVDLDEVQTQVVSALYAEHREAFRAFAEQWRPIMREWDQRKTDVLSSPDATGRARWNIETGREGALEKAANRQTEMDKSFLDRVVQLLEDQQIEQWFTFQRTFNRDRWLGTLAIFGETRLDLQELVKAEIEDAELDEEMLASINSLLIEWARTVDVVISDYVRANIEVARNFWRTQAEWIVFHDETGQGYFPVGASSRICSGSEGTTPDAPCVARPYSDIHGVAV